MESPDLSGSRDKASLEGDVDELVRGAAAAVPGGWPGALDDLRDAGVERPTRAHHRISQGLKGFWILARFALRGVRARGVKDPAKDPAKDPRAEK